MTPVELEILLYYYNMYQSKHPRFDVSDIIKAHNFLVKYEFIKKQLCMGGEYYYFITEKGQAYVRLLCSVPWPKQIWTDQQGNEIKF